MASVEHVISGSGIPASAPPSMCAHYLDTVDGTLYLASGIGSANDWRPVYSDSGWVTLTALNGFAYPPEARKINGIVYLRGFIWLSEIEFGEHIAQLPVGWRPGAQFYCTKVSGQRVRRLSIPGMSDGDGELVVSVQSGDSSGDYFEFDGISFPVG